MRQNVGRQDGQDTSDLFGKFPLTCDERQNYTHWELFEMRCCLYSKANIVSFFHIEGLHISAITLSAFRRSARTATTADFTFPLR
jgi:hypothetical protein